MMKQLVEEQIGRALNAMNAQPEKKKIREWDRDAYPTAQCIQSINLAPRKL